MGLDICCKCEEINFRAGSYSSFGNFRMILANMLGFENVEYKYSNMSMDTYDLDSMNSKTPFWEFFRHSDCDGELDVVEFNALLKDFETYQTKFEQYVRDHTEKINARYYIEKYQTWLYAVNHVALEGCTLLFR